MRYSIKILSNAKHDIELQFVWLVENRNLDTANCWLYLLEKALNKLESWPERWQKVEFSGRVFHRMVVNRTTLVFYAVNNNERNVEVYAIRGATEDWTKQKFSL